MDGKNEQILTSATERALVIDEIIFAIGEKLKRPKDICSASACCKAWRKILIHLIARCADVYVEDAESFMDFLRSYPSVKWNCQALRLLQNTPVSLNDNSFATATEAVARITEFLSSEGRLKHFMCALPEQLFVPFPDELFVSLKRLTNSLQELNMTIPIEQCKIFFSSHFRSLRSLRLYLDSQNTESQTLSTNYLYHFLQKHRKLELLDLFLGSCFNDVDFTGLHFPNLYCFSIISRSSDVRLMHFLEKQHSLRSLSVEIVAPHETQTRLLSEGRQEYPLTRTSLPNLLAVSVSLSSLYWLREVLDRGNVMEEHDVTQNISAYSKGSGIRCLQLTLETMPDLEQILQMTTTLRSTLRALDILVSSQDLSLLKILKRLNNEFTNLVELRIFAYEPTDILESAGSKQSQYNLVLLGWVLPLIKIFDNSGNFSAFSLITLNKSHKGFSRKLSNEELIDLTSYLFPTSTQIKDEVVNVDYPLSSHLKYIIWDDLLIQVGTENGKKVLTQIYPYERPKQGEKILSPLPIIFMMKKSLLHALYASSQLQTSGGLPLSSLSFKPPNQRRMPHNENTENASESAVSRCLSLPEIIHEIASHLLDPGDLCAASQCNRLWNEILVPFRMSYPHVSTDYVGSFLEYLRSNQHAAHHCQSLRIIADDGDEEDEEDEESEDAPEVINEILNKVVDDDGLGFFMYALPGEPHKPLASSVWSVLEEKLSKTLEGLYIEVHRRHWSTILNCKFTHLTYLRLFLESDDREPSPSDFPPEFDPKTALLDFLNQHTALQTLHLYLGNDYSNLDLSSVFLPELYSFLLISKAENVQIQKFIENHKSLRALDCYTDADIEPFDAQVLPNIQALQVSALTIHWYKNMLADNASREAPIRHLQISSAQELNFAYVAEHLNPIGPVLRCLELIFWSRDVHLMSALSQVNTLFPNLVELSLFIPAWGTESSSEEPKPFELKWMLEHFAGSKHFQALSVSDPVSATLTDDTIHEVLSSSPVPQNLKYIVWRAQTFHIERTEDDVVVRRTYHPRNFRGSQWKRDWPDEMIFEHI